MSPVRQNLPQLRTEVKTRTRVNLKYHLPEWVIVIPGSGLQLHIPHLRGAGYALVLVEGSRESS